LPVGGKKVQTRPEYMLIAAMSAFALTGIVATVLYESREPAPYVEPYVEPVLLGAGTEVPEDAGLWFQSIRQFCNPVEVETHFRWQPAPPTPDGDMYKAACYALAGRIERAREVIEGLPQELRYHAAGVVFNAGHPAADAGDDVAAGPLMELVVEYWPNHYMALYHAGAARFESGSYEVAQGYLERFLEEYSAEDSWRSSAISMLEQIAGR
jgi:tetratricopeptide (TPR) repeat protein